MSWLRLIPTSLPDHPLGDLAHLLRRQRAPQVLGALLLALLSAVLLLRSEARATDAERRWGSLTTVVVARHDVPAGTELGRAQVRMRRLPTATLASDALTEVAWNELSPVGLRPVTDRNVAEDEPIRAGILVGDGASGVGRGSVVAFPDGTLAPRLDPGDHVRVIAGQPLDAEGGSFPSAPAVGGVVVGPPSASPGADDDGAVTGPADPTPGWIAWVAVPPRDADEVARIALSGSVALVLDSPGPDDSNVYGAGLGGPVNTPR